MESICTMQNLLRSCLLIGTASLLAFWGISLLLAWWAVQPVARAWDQQRQFAADASHELKTPLKVILTNAELLQDPARSPAERDRFAGQILAMAHQMRGLVENLLELPEWTAACPPPWRNWTGAVWCPRRYCPLSCYASSGAGASLRHRGGAGGLGHAHPSAAGGGDPAGQRPEVYAADRHHHGLAAASGDKTAVLRRRMAQERRLSGRAWSGKPWKPAGGRSDSGNSRFAAQGRLGKDKEVCPTVAAGADAKREQPR